MHFPMIKDLDEVARPIWSLGGKHRHDGEHCSEADKHVVVVGRRGRQRFFFPLSLPLADCLPYCQPPPTKNVDNDSDNARWQCAFCKTRVWLAASLLAIGIKGAEFIAFFQNKHDSDNYGVLFRCAAPLITRMCLLASPDHTPHTVHVFPVP
uniref:LITAF domain-containing protein n=1 Tax=Panagrellus redivivus TaxID=6233 RepID=A0A7E4UTR8_PANRE